MALERELDTFQRELPDLLSNPENHGKYVLIQADRILGLYPSFETGLDAGYQQCELEPFLVKKVVEHEEPVYFSRNAIPCR